ncbi:MAG: hypothetical protein HEP71_19770 [Roseivirga sp.]|nr:hypothetical protein [Roseivirga sp.]
MKYKILGVLMLFFGLLFFTVMIGAFMKGLPEFTVEDRGTQFNVVYLIGLIGGMLMMILAIFVLFRNGIRNLRK